MNYYPFHIGDYAKKTRHLSWDEDMAYRRLMDAYYLQEGPLPGDKRQVYRLVMAATKAQREAVDVVLAEFFELREGGFSNHRCDEELSKWKAKGEKAAASAKAKWDRAKAHANAPQSDASAYADAMRTQCEGNANQEPEPITKTNSALTSAKDARAPEPPVQQADPEHWKISQAILADHQWELDDWELDFLHSIKWAKTITKAQAEKLKAIQDKVLSTGKPTTALPSVRRGTPQYDAWITHYRRTKGSAAFYEKQEILTVPTEFPPQHREAAE